MELLELREDLLLDGVSGALYELNVDVWFEEGGRDGFEKGVEGLDRWKGSVEECESGEMRRRGRKWRHLFVDGRVWIEWSDGLVEPPSQVC
jgi:hypothetical protein